MTSGEIDDTLEVTGDLMALDTVNLSAKTAGRVTDVLVREGDTVRAGQTLITLDETEAESQVRATGAAISAAQARLSQAKPLQKLSQRSPTPP
jgi:HlyD family secretion protein